MWGERIVELVMNDFSGDLIAFLLGIMFAYSMFLS